MSHGPRSLRLAPILVATALVAGCAAHVPRAPAAVTGPPMPLAMLPLENLSGRAENGDKYTRLVWASLGRTGRFQLVDPGEVDAALGELRVRSANFLTREQVGRVAGRLSVRWIVGGTLLECGTIRTPDGDIPSFGLTLRVLDGRTGHVAWSDMIARTGQDRETVFGWGRQESLEKLAESAVGELIERMKFPERPDSLLLMEGKP